MRIDVLSPTRKRENFFVFEGGESAVTRGERHGLVVELSRRRRRRMNL